MVTDEQNGQNDKTGTILIISGCDHFLVNGHNWSQMVKIVKKAKKPKYWSNSNISLPLVTTKIPSSSQKKQIKDQKKVLELREIVC